MITTGIMNHGEGLANPQAIQLLTHERRFDQHYQSFCGFESIESAQTLLAVFEKLYRLTPFSDDAQPAIRGKCPLELAGYDIRHLPVATLWNGLSVEWPIEGRQIDVPIR
jgi:hypothetical protein